MEGFLLIDKPAGMTSFDVIARLRRLTGISRIGHAGTLDPFATGLLIVGVGRGATKHLGDYLGMSKEYVGTAVLGATSDTQDGTGALVLLPDPTMPDAAALREAMVHFLGPQQQIPPMYSAKKIGGKKLYELARKGMEVERKPANIVIERLNLDAYVPPHFTFTVLCSSGTYVRTLAHDIGAAVGTGAYLETLRRTTIGEFSVENASTLESLGPNDWQEKLIPVTGVDGRKPTE
jgi:tRNA pseudouridine55 synthase